MHLAFNLASCELCEDFRLITIPNPSWNLYIAIRIGNSTVRCILARHYQIVVPFYHI